MQSTPLTKVQPVSNGRPGVGVNVERLVEDEIFAESRRCRKITNKHSGMEFLRKLDGNAQWPILYKYAKKNPAVFELDFDAVDAEDVNEEGPLLDTTGRPMFTEAELLTRDIRQLRELGAVYEVTGRQKTELIQKILKAQRA